MAFDFLGKILTSIIGEFGEDIEELGQKLNSFGPSNKAPLKPGESRSCSPKTKATTKQTTEKTTENLDNNQSKNNQGRSKASIKPRNIKTDRAAGHFKEIDFKTYEQGIRGMAFPFDIFVKDVKNKEITVVAKFCTMEGKWIKSLLPEMADTNGDLMVTQRFFSPNTDFHDSSYLFLPYGVLDLYETQDICLNLGFYVEENGKLIQLLRYVEKFSYYVYKDNPREHRKNTDENDDNKGFKALIAVVCHVIKADGVTAPEEIRAVINFFKSYKEVDKLWLQNQLRENLEVLPNLDTNLGILKKYFHTQDFFTFVSFFLTIVTSDNIVTQSEIDIVEKIAMKLGLPRADYEILKMCYLNKYSGEDEKASDTKTWSVNTDDYECFHDYKQYAKYHAEEEARSRRYATDSETHNYSSDYRYTHNSVPSGYSYYWKLFDLRPNATRKELKKAYHMKCMLYHPDKYENESLEIKKNAENHFKEIQNAYEALLNIIK